MTSVHPAPALGSLSDRRRRHALIAAVITALLLTLVFVNQRTRAAFSASTANPVDQWAAGTVVLGDDDSGSALFSASGLLPGDTGSKCIKVSYSGSLAATVKLYGGSLTGSLGPYIDLVVQEATVIGNNGTFAGGCTGFAGTQIYSGTLSGFTAAASSYATGVGSFAPTGTGQYRVYRFDYTLNASAPSAQQGASAGATFTWESRS